MKALRIGIVTCSDRRSTGEAEDTAGPAIAQLCRKRGWVVAGRVICMDDAEVISAAIVRKAEELQADVVFTIGGTGLGLRDVTPEATLAVAEREVPGIAEAIRAGSLEITGRAMLSRAVAAQRGNTLIINLPGSEKAAREGFGFIADQLEHAIDMLSGEGHD